MFEFETLYSATSRRRNRRFFLFCLGWAPSTSALFLSAQLLARPRAGASCVTHTPHHTPLYIIATARVQPAEASLTLTGNIATVNPVEGSASRLCNFSACAYPLSRPALCPSQTMDASPVALNLCVVASPPQPARCRPKSQPICHARAVSSYRSSYYENKNTKKYNACCTHATSHRLLLGGGGWGKRGRFSSSASSSLLRGRPHFLPRLCA